MEAYISTEKEICYDIQEEIFCYILDYYFIKVKNIVYFVSKTN